MLWKVICSSWFWGILMDLEAITYFHYFKKPVLWLAEGCLKIVRPSVSRLRWRFCTFMEGMELLLVITYFVFPMTNGLNRPVSKFMIMCVVLEALTVVVVYVCYDERRQVLRLQKERERVREELEDSSVDNHPWCSWGCTDVCFAGNAARTMFGRNTTWEVVDEKEVLG